MTNAVEVAGWALLVAFAAVVWPPAALAVAGLELILWANTRSPSSGGRVGAFVAAARAAYRAQQQPEEIGPAGARRGA